MNFIKYSNIYFILSGTLILFSIVFLFVFGLKLGIDFTGGSIMEIEFEKERPKITELRSDIKKSIKNSDFTLQESGSKGIILRKNTISEKDHKKIVEAFGGKEKIVEKRFEAIGPIIGSELKKDTIFSLFFGFIFITFYVAIVFRRVSRPVPSWQYGIAALVALFHDILITCGIFAVFGHFWGMEVNVPFAAALLTILGYSINDSIVVFDRCRENLIRSKKEFNEILNNSLKQILARSLFTSITTLIVLFALYFFGGETISAFILTMIIGIILGTYSSIFVATPLLYKFARR